MYSLMFRRCISYTPPSYGMHVTILLRIPTDSVSEYARTVFRFLFLQSSPHACTSTSGILSGTWTVPRPSCTFLCPTCHLYSRLYGGTLNHVIHSALFVKLWKLIYKIIGRVWTLGCACRCMESVWLAHHLHIKFLVWIQGRVSHFFDLWYTRSWCWLDEIIVADRRVDLALRS
jgi:hypothetical protein